MGVAKNASPEACAAASPEVKLCDICGALGYEEFLAVCTQCNERVEHVYCMQALCDSVPLNWLCEGCQKRPYNETCDEQNERLLLKINSTTQDIKTPFLCQEKKSENEHCMHEQEREEVKERTPLIQGQARKGAREETTAKIVQSEVFSISAEGVLQASAGDVKAGCGLVGCKMACFQNHVDSERFHHGLKGLAPSKLPLRANHGLPKSNLSESDLLLPFLLPSRPKEMLRSSSRLSSVVANKNAGLLPDHGKITADTPNEHARKDVSLLASRLGVGSSCQQSYRKFPEKSQGAMTADCCSKRGNMNSSQMSCQSNIFFGNQKDMFCIEASKARQLAREEEAGIMETTSHRKQALFGSEQLVLNMRNSLETKHGALEKPLNILQNGISEIQKPPPHGLLGMQLNASLGAPRYHAPQLPFPQSSFHALPLSNEWQLQQQHFDQPQARPWRPYGRNESMPPLQSNNYACELNISNGDYVPPQLQAVPHVQKVWRGCFNVSTSANCSVVYNGIQAHPSNKADPKVWKAAQSLPNLLRVKELTRGLDNDTWPRRFLDSPPTSDNIGMFFFPVNMESHDAYYKPLADHLIAYDLVLRAESDSLYLLIFHSQLLPKAEQLWDGRHYLWGVFKTKKSNSSQRVTMMVSAQAVNNSASLNANDEIVDMDIDMVGGIELQPSTAEGMEPPAPPLPPGSPPAKPPPPPTPSHHSDEDMDISFCCKGLPSDPPSPPPTPPLSQLVIILESSCNLSTARKHKMAVQQGSCSTSKTLDSLGGSENK